VGHETDFTLVDFVADLRAPTPSAAAAAVVPDREEVLDQLTAIQRQLWQQAADRLALEKRHCQQIQLRLQRLHPRRQLDLRRQSLDDRERRLHEALRRKLERYNERNVTAHLRLEALNPLGVLRRGYSIVQKADGTVVTTPQFVQPGEALHVQSAGGAYAVTVG
jgi:exodeoxyribonuclease VII large subunit